jgi:hypothetical protein
MAPDYSQRARFVRIVPSAQKNLHQQAQSETDGNDAAGVSEECAGREPRAGSMWEHRLIITSTLPNVLRNIESLHVILLVAANARPGQPNNQKYRAVKLKIHTWRQIAP